MSAQVSESLTDDSFTVEESEALLADIAQHVEAERNYHRNDPSKWIWTDKALALFLRPPLCRADMPPKVLVDLFLTFSAERAGLADCIDERDTEITEANCSHYVGVLTGRAA